MQLPHTAGMLVGGLLVLCVLAFSALLVEQRRSPRATAAAGGAIEGSSSRRLGAAEGVDNDKVRLLWQCSNLRQAAWQNFAGSSILVGVRG
jgi:hypothetical protein